MKILAFGDIHFHHSHRFSQLTVDGPTTRELEHLMCADRILTICAEQDVERIVFLGDCYGPVGDVISCQTQMVVADFWHKLSSVYPVDMIVGNHDVSGQVNNQYAHKLYPFKHWNNIELYDQPTVVDNFVFMPYCISDDFAEAFLQAVENKQDKIICSHLEIKNIPVGENIYTKHGVDLDLLKQFKMTLQGHFHSGGSYGKNVQVAGSTQRLSFKDPGRARKNVLIYDTEANTVKRESLDCPDWLTFDDDNIDDVLKADVNNYVKVTVSSDILLTDEISAKLKTFKSSEVQIDISRISVNHKIESAMEISSEDELSVLTQFVNNSENSEEQKELLRQEGARLLAKI